MANTFIFYDDEQADSISGLSVSSNLPMRDEMYNRHVRFTGQDGGLWAFSAQYLTRLHNLSDQMLPTTAYPNRILT